MMKISGTRLTLFTYACCAVLFQVLPTGSGGIGSRMMTSAFVARQFPSKKLIKASTAYTFPLLSSYSDSPYANDPPPSLYNQQAPASTSSDYYSTAEQQASIQGGGAPVPPRERAPPLVYNGESRRDNMLSPTGPLDWDLYSATLIQGNSLRTWALPRDDTSRIKLSLRTEGRPMTSSVELWQGPDYTPMKLKVYVEDGNARPFNCILETPMSSNTLAVYNTGHMEFPFFANVQEYTAHSISSNYGLANAPSTLYESTTPRTVQGGSTVSYPFPPQVASVQFLLKTDGRNLKARVELMQGPNTDKQVMELYSSDGYARPFYAIVETPGSGNVVRIINKNTMEFPFVCSIGPYSMGEDAEEGEFIID